MLGRVNLDDNESMYYFGKMLEKIGVEEKHQFNREWIRLCYNLLKDEGTIWISGTLHNIYSIGMSLEQEGFKIINNITWKKLNPPPNISCRYLFIPLKQYYGLRKILKKLNINLITN